MASEYCKYSEVEQRLFEPDVADKGQIEALITAASRQIDRLCAVADGYFDKAADAASNKTFYGSGTEWLRLPPYVGSIVAANVNYSDTALTEPPFTVRGETGQYLVTDKGYCWAHDEAIVVSAKWGFSAIPAEIVQACVELVITNWRTSDPARERAVSDAGDEEFRIAKIPGRVKMVCEEWKKKARVAVFA